MEEIEKLVAEMSIVSFEVETMHFVDITHVKDPHNFYIRPIQYKRILSIFASTKPAHKAKSVNVKDIIVFNLGYSCGIQKYLRGQITNIRNQGNRVICDIFTVDFGFIEKAVPKEHIWKCNKRFRCMPPLATLCQLTNCYPIGRHGFPFETISAFKFFVLHEPANMYVFDKKHNKLIVGLLNSHTDDITTLMVIGGFSQLGYGKKKTKWTPAVVRKKLSYSFISLKVKQTIHVRMQSGKSLKEFYVVTVSDYEKHLKEMDVVTFYARRESSLCRRDFLKGELVCVKYDDKNIYERGFIKKIVDSETALVTLVDWGRDEEVPLAKLKYMSSMCLRTPVITIYCSAGKNKFWDVKLDKFLTPGFEFLITIKVLGSEFAKPNIVEIFPLREEEEGAKALPDKNEEKEGPTALPDKNEEEEGAKALPDKNEEEEGAKALPDKNEEKEGPTALPDKNEEEEGAMALPDKKEE